jgi:biotin carboxylase
MVRRRVLLLSATTGYQLRSFNDAAERLGVELIFATDRCHTLDDPWRDAAVAVRFHAEDESLDRIVDAARVRPFDAIVTVGDRPTVLAARAADRLGIAGHPPGAAAASGDKLTSRRRFADAGLRGPWFYVLPDDQSSTDAASDARLQYPCVVKPTGLSGSRGVIRVGSRGEFVAAVDRVRALLARKDVRALQTASQILVEEYIDGPEYAIEGVLTAGELTVFAVFDKPDPLVGPFFEETIYVTPPALDAASLDTIADAVQHATRALRLRHGAVHAECRVAARGVVILEVAARPIGGLCSQVLRFERDGGATTDAVSLEEILLRHAIGEDVRGWRRERRAAAVMMIPIPKRGLLKRVEGTSDASAVPGVEEVRITAKVDQLLEPLPEAGSYLGFIFGRSAVPRDAESAVREAHRRLTFILETAIDVTPVG